MNTSAHTRYCELRYPGKWPETDILGAVPGGQLRQLDKPNPACPHSFYVGDNFPILHLLKQQYAGKVDLIYIDPPFATGRHFASRDKEHAYSDELLDHHYLEFLRRRLYLLRELLSQQGSIYVHIDKKIGHYVKLLMDEVFGYENFLNDITRIKCNPKNFERQAFGNYSDMILFYAKKRGQHIWQACREPLCEDDLQRLFPKIHPLHGRYTTHPLHAPGETLQGDTGQPWRGLMPPKGRHWRYARQVLDELQAQGLIEWSSTGNPRKMVFAKDHKGTKIQDVWTFKDKGAAYASYPTQKNQDLLLRIIQHSSTPGSLVLDAFAGSGSTLLAAHALGRHFMGMDESEHALKVVRQNFKQAGVACNFFRYQV